MMQTKRYVLLLVTLISFLGAWGAPQRAAAYIESGLPGAGDRVSVNALRGKDADLAWSGGMVWAGRMMWAESDGWEDGVETITAADTSRWVGDVQIRAEGPILGLVP
jgi:hypothetical protein